MTEKRIVSVRTITDPEACPFRDNPVEYITMGSGKCYKTGEICSYKGDKKWGLEFPDWCPLEDAE